MASVGPSCCDDQTDAVGADALDADAALQNLHDLERVQPLRA